MVHQNLPPQLTYLINRSMRESVFPTSEKCAKVMPIYKSGEKGVKYICFGGKEFVQYNGYRSEAQYIPCGVPQGSILGPLLFVLLVNDVGTVLNNVNTFFMQTTRCSILLENGAKKLNVS